MSDESSGSDFDDDEDPDKIEVPGKIFNLVFTKIFICQFVPMFFQ